MFDRDRQKYEKIKLVRESKCALEMGNQLKLRSVYLIKWIAAIHILFKRI